MTVLNFFSLIFLIGTVVAARKKNYIAHKFLAAICMFISLGLVIIFIKQRLIDGSSPYHMDQWSVSFLVLLGTHILAAMVTLFLSIVVVSLGLSEKHRYKYHKKVAYILLPIWFYSSLTGLALGGLTYLSKNKVTSSVGVDRPAIDFKALNGLSGLSGEALNPVKWHEEKNLIIHFWASWCAPCIEELPSLVNLARQNISTLKILAVTMDEDPVEAQKFLKPLGELPTNLLTVLESKARLSLPLKVDALPQSFIFKKGQIVKSISGAINWQSDPVKNEFSIKESSQ